ncbi:MAG: glycosyltransferase [Patescibacteria group bacterium]
MKILHITPAYTPAYRYGGPISSVHTLNKWLVRAGVDVTVYATNADGRGTLDVPLETPVEQDGVKVVYFPISFPRSWFYSRTMHKALREHCKEFDIVHVTSVFLAASTLGAYYAKKCGKPYIISPRGSLMIDPLTKKSSLKKTFYLKFIEKNNLKNASAIHFTAPKEEKEYRTKNFPIKRSIVIPNGIDVDKKKVVSAGRFKKRLGISPEREVILYHGRIGWKKGFDTLIPAFGRVHEKNPGAILVIAVWSDEGYKATIMQLIAKYQLETSILFTGPLEGIERAEAFVDTDVFVLGSYSENFGVALGQAMAASVPVVVTEGVAIGSDVLEAKAGLVVPKDDRALADAILKILGDPVEGKKMGERGRALVAMKYSYNKIAERFIEEYSKCTHKDNFL